MIMETVLTNIYIGIIIFSVVVGVAALIFQRYLNKHKSE